MQVACSRDVPPPCYGRYYFAGSNPVVSHADRPKRPKSFTPTKSNGCFPAHAYNIRTRGAHEFYNMMWDPTVYRGPTDKTFYEAEVDRCRKRKELDASVKRRKFPRKPMLIGGIARPSLTLQDQNQSEKRRLEDMGIQTEKYLEELTADVTKKEAGSQIDGVAANPIEYRLVPFMTGKNQQCQTEKKLTYPFKEHAAALQKQLSKKVLEQSLIETTEELELEAVRIEKRKYIQRRCEEMQKIDSFLERKTIANERRARAINKAQFEFSLEADAEARVAATMFGIGSMGGLLGSTFDTLKAGGFMPAPGDTELGQSAAPYFNDAMRMYYAGRKIVSKKLLDEMMQNVLNIREAEYATGESLDSKQAGMLREELGEDPVDFSPWQDPRHTRFGLDSNSTTQLSPTANLELNSNPRQSQNRYSPSRARNSKN